MSMNYTAPGRMVTHNMVTTQFELDGFKSYSHAGRGAWNCCTLAFHRRHDWRHSANHSRRQHHIADQFMREDSI